jgi:plasmid stabilization system protein ParE
VQSELKATQTELVDIELLSKSTASEREEAAEKERRELRSEIDRLDAQLKATTQRAVSGEEKIKLYKERVQNITVLLKQSESNLDKLKRESLQWP